MAKRTKKNNPRSVAQLTAHNDRGEAVLQQELSFSDYYDQPHDLIDSSQFRRERSIVLVKGKIYDASGKLVEEFENKYSADGSYLRGRMRFDDGTIVED